MEKRMIKKLLAVLMIITILATDFFVLGSNLITYAAQINNETNNSNIEFSAYFKNGENRVDSIEESIKNDNLKLYAEIKVKNEGYFNGAIEIQNSNFNIKSTNIGNVDGNKVNLNQINAGDVVEVELGIEPVIADKVAVDMLSKTSTVKLTGTYMEATYEGIEIQAEKSVCVNYQPDETTQAELETDIITNKVLSVNGTNKRIVQLLVKSRLTENQYPVKQTTLNVNVPELSEKAPEEVNVLAIGELATNGETAVSSNNWTSQNGEIQITLNNEVNANNEISWAKNVYDELVVTFIYAEDVDASKVEISTDSEIKVYNATNTYTAIFGEGIQIQEPNSVIIGRTENTTTEMYKGNLYANIEAPYNTETTLIVTNTNVADEITIHEGPDVFGTAESELAANTKYISTEINKEKMLEILGQDGSITIVNGTTTTVINKDTVANESGNIVISHADGAAELDITTTKPANTGYLELKHEKAITANTYTRTQLQTINTLETKITTSAKLADTKIVENSREASLELKETISKAELTINKQNLSTTVTNEDVVIGVKLITDGMQYDLFKNPTIRLKLPEAVESISVNSTDRLYADEFGKPVANYDETTKTITISLEGEQTAYPASSATQLYLQLNLDITLSKIAPTQTDKITMTYVNENATQYYGETTDVGIVEQPIQISSPNGLVKMFNLSSNENTSLSETMTQLVTSEEAGKTYSFETVLINNTGLNLNNIRIIGKLPTTGNKITEQENTFETTLKSITAPNATIYYTENVDATTDTSDTTNGWTTNLAELTNAKLYLIKLDTLNNASNYVANISVEMPNSIPEDVLSYAEYKVIYDTEYEGETDIEENSRKIVLMTSLIAGLETTFTATVGQETLKNGDTVKEGEVIKYTTTIKNNTNQTLENVVVNAGVPEGTVVVEPIRGEYTLEDGMVVDGYVYIPGKYYEEKSDVKEISETITLEAGQTYIKEYEVRINTDITAGTEISNKAIITYDNSSKESNEIKNTLAESNVRVTIKRALDESIQLIAGSLIEYNVIIENLSSEKITNLELEIKSSDITLKGVISDTMSLTSDEIPEKIVIEEIPVNGISSIFVTGIIDEEVDRINTSTIVTDSNNKYRSNLLTEELPYADAKITLSSPQNNMQIKEGDTVQYNITAENTGSIEGVVKVIDNIPEYLTVEKIYKNGNLITEYRDETDGTMNLEALGNSINQQALLGVGEKMQLDIITKVIYIPGEADGTEIINKADVKIKEVYKGTSEEVKHILKSSEEPSLKNIISGVAWIDENENGQIDAVETNLSGITVKLFNTSTNNYVVDENGSAIQTVTNESGEYVFTKIQNGSYKIIFEYDLDKYETTTYCAEGVDTVNASKAKTQDITINGQTITVIGTENIDLQDNIENINIGLKEKALVDDPENPDIPENPEDPDDPENPDTPDNPDQPEQPKDTKSISGLAWLDEDRNGQKDGSEKGLSGIKVRIYDVSTKNYLKDDKDNIVETTTDENGKYIFENIEKGEYIILFEYNMEEYETTEYMAEGVDTAVNSKVVLKKIEINGEDKTLAVTDTINVQDDVANINIGLKEKLTFDLELNKYISRVVVQNSKGTKAYDYENETFAKVEIHRKQVQGSLVVLEYTIKVKNNGEMAGYARNIVDYLPSGLTFSSELNKDWYLSESYLHTKSLENVEINPGEEKEIKLILTKTMTNENVGLINNRAEIYQDYNKYGNIDIDSTPNNQVPEEDDFGSVDVIIGISTGGSTIAYIILLMINMVLIGIAIKLMIRNNIIKISTRKGRR